jgi:hypothetical protein
MSTWNRYSTYGISKPETIKDESIPSRLSALIANPVIQDRDKSFAESLKTGYEKYKSLTVKQNEAFLRMEQKYVNGTNPATAINDWYNSFDEEKRKILNACAKYYINTDYFNDLARKVIDNPTWVPTEKQYRAMCENKYAQKLIKNLDGNPRYSVNDVVTVRSNFRYGRFHDTSIGVIIKAYDCNTPVAGNRQYDILPIGSDTIIKVLEKQIKIARDKDLSQGD